MVVSSKDVEFIEACMDNKLDKVIHMLNHENVNINVVDDRKWGNQRTPLHRAAYNGFKELTMELLKRGADKTLKTSSGKTAADLACTDDVREMINSFESKAHSAEQVTNIMQETSQINKSNNKSTQGAQQFINQMTNALLQQTNLGESQMTARQAEEELLNARSDIEELKGQIQQMTHIHTFQLQEKQKQIQMLTEQLDQAKQQAPPSFHVTSSSKQTSIASVLLGQLMSDGAAIANLEHQDVMNAVYFAKTKPTVEKELNDCIQENNKQFSLVKELWDEQLEMASKIFRCKTTTLRYQLMDQRNNILSQIDHLISSILKSCSDWKPNVTRWREYTTAYHDFVHESSTRNSVNNQLIEDVLPDITRARKSYEAQLQATLNEAMVYKQLLDEAQYVLQHSRNEQAKQGASMLLSTVSLLDQRVATDEVRFTNMHKLTMHMSTQNNQMKETLDRFFHLERHIRRLKSEIELLDIDMETEENIVNKEEQEIALKKKTEELESVSREYSTLKEQVQTYLCCPNHHTEANSSQSTEPATLSPDTLEAMGLYLRQIKSNQTPITINSHDYESLLLQLPKMDTMLQPWSVPQGWFQLIFDRVIQNANLLVKSHSSCAFTIPLPDFSTGENNNILIVQYEGLGRLLAKSIYEQEKITWQFPLLAPHVWKYLLCREEELESIIQFSDLEMVFPSEAQELKALTKQSDLELMRLRFPTTANHTNNNNSDPQQQLGVVTRHNMMQYMNQMMHHLLIHRYSNHLSAMRRGFRSSPFNNCLLPFYHLLRRDIIHQTTTPPSSSPT